MLSMFPATLDFGCVAQGFIYNLDVTVTNIGTRPQRIKVTCVKSKGSDVNKVTTSSISQQFASGILTFHDYNDYYYDYHYYHHYICRNLYHSYY